MEASETIAVTLEKFVFGGQTLGRTPDNKVIFVWGGLPGEKVKVRETKNRKGFLEGVVDEVLEPAPERVAAEEAHYLSCSPWQIIEYAKEGEWKREITRELFKRSFGIELPEFEAISPSEPYGYRNKLEFSFTEDATGSLELAFFRRQSKEKRPTDGCVLASKALNSVARAILELLRSEGVSAGDLKSLLLRSDRGGNAAAMLYVKNVEFPSIVEAAEDIAGLSRFSVIYSDPRSPASITTRVIADTGERTLEDEVLGARFKYEARSFFQVNPAMFEEALKDIRRYTAAENTFFDLYAGVGVIGTLVSAKHVVFVEPEESSRSFIEANCERNGVKNFNIVERPAEKYLTRLEKEGAGLPSDAVLMLDPPRAGLHPKIIKRVKNMRPKRLIYLSCNPATQGRDIADLLEYYEIKFFKAYNFFPRTPHVETLAVLDLKL